MRETEREKEKERREKTEKTDGKKLCKRKNQNQKPTNKGLTRFYSPGDPCKPRLTI
jgi:hypothetical protein